MRGRECIESLAPIPAQQGFQRAIERLTVYRGEAALALQNWRQPFTETIQQSHISDLGNASVSGAPTEHELRELLQRHRGNVAAVGRELGKERMQIHRWLKKYNIDLGTYR